MKSESILSDSIYLELCRAAKEDPKALEKLIKEYKEQVCEVLDKHHYSNYTVCTLLLSITQTR